MTTNFTRLLKTLTVALLLPVCYDAGAQQLQASLSHYTTDEGLASNSISFMAQDDYGYLWLATWNGISRFDGFSFYNYKTGNSSGIRGMHNRVEGLCVDQSQNVWLRMYDGRIFVINRQTDRIEDPLVGISGHDEYRTNYPLYVTSSGDVIVSFGQVGLYKFHLDRNGLKQQHIMTSSLEVTEIVEGYHNDIWVGTNKGVHRIDMSNLSLERKGYFLDESITELASNGYNIFAGTRSGKIMQFSYGQEPRLIKDIGQEITSLFVDSHGTLWYSDPGNGAYRLNVETGDSKFFNQHVLVPEFSGRGAFFNEAMGVVWVRMNHGGYGYYNRETDEVEYFHNDPSNPWNLSNSLNAQLEMNDGVVWESTSRRGLDKLEILKNTITRTLLLPGAESTLDNEIRAMYYDKERHLTFLGNKHGSLFVFDANGNRNVITHDSSGRPISRPYGMSKDSKGNYWLCDKDNGLYKITPTDNGGYNIINIRHDDKDIWSLSSNSAYQAAEDREGNIWVATYGGGVNIVRKNKAGKYIALHSKNALKRYPINSYQKVRTITMAKDGKIWAGTTDGILIMSLHNNNITIEQMQAPEDLTKGLMSNDIVNLACDQQGVMWVGTNSGGLSHTTGKDKNGTWTFKNYGVADGLPSEEIRSITFDEKDNVWFATDHILCSYDVKKGIFTTFSQLDGVDDTMCSEGAAITVGNGKILFGTLNGYYTIDRKKLTNSTGSLLRLRITDFYINDVLQSPRLTDNYDYYIPEGKSVELPSHGTTFSFRFAALNYQLQHRVHYQYKLDGFDSEWHNADKGRMVSYSDVPAGTYHFQVKAFLLESPDAYDMRTIEVVVPPYFIFSTTAVWIYMALIAALLLYLMWWYQERLRKRHLATLSPDETTGNDAEEPATDETATAGQEQEVTDDYEIIED